MNSFLLLARFNQPIGTWLLLLPCLWSISIAAPDLPNFKNYILFAIGAIVMRSAGCVYNDIIDRNLDSMVLRTSDRPIPSKKISVLHATLFLIFLLLIGLLILIQFNKFTIYVGVASLILIFTYPFMKRITYWPQAFLGLTFNWGALLGWASVRGELDIIPVVIYFAGFFWTLGYDTIYAHQDKNDDKIIGIKSTAIKFGDNTKFWISIFFILATILFIICGYIAKMNWAFFFGVFLSTGHLFWQVTSLNINCPKNCQRRFLSNRDYGLIILVAIILAKTQV